jgi:hypothetical protein
LNDIDVETAGRAFGQNLGVKRAGLRPHIAGVYLREILAKSLHDAGGTGLVLVTIEYQLTFLLGFCHISVRREIMNFCR